MMSFYYKKRYLRIIDIIPAMKVSKFAVGSVQQTTCLRSLRSSDPFQEAIEFFIVIGCPKKRKNKKRTT